jgi:hypothetical protein
MILKSNLATLLRKHAFVWPIIGLTGAKPVPAYIGLACKGWEAVHRTHAA